MIEVVEPRRFVHVVEGEVGLVFVLQVCHPFTGATISEKRLEVPLEEIGARIEEDGEEQIPPTLRRDMD